jgi:hypothetical protein
MMLHHPRVAQTRNKEKQKTEKKCIVAESAGTRELIKRRGMVWHVWGAMSYTRKRLEADQ